MLQINDDILFFNDLSPILNAVPDSLVVINYQGKIVHLNIQTEKLFGYTRSELIGQQIEILIPARYTKKHQEHRNMYFKNPCVRPMGAGLDLYGLKKDGTEFPVEISLNTLNTKHGTLTIAAVRDVTLGKYLAQELTTKNIELEAASLAKNNFLSSMSHELRTPLNAIIGFTGILSMRLAGPLTPDQETHLKTIRSSADHLLSLINDLLDLAKIESGKVDLGINSVICQSIITDVINTITLQVKNKPIIMSTNIPDTPILLNTCQRSLIQIITNLINNAIKYTEEGNILIELCQNTLDGKDWVIFSIQDTGIGINKTDMRKLFVPFERFIHSKELEGTGLGLHISQKLAGLLGGYITCTSEPGKGSNFMLYIPKNEVKNVCPHSNY